MLNVNPGLTISDVQAVLAGKMHWYRVANNVWVVQTARGKEWIDNLLRNMADPSGRLLIVRLDIGEHKGLMPRAFWDWLENRILLGELGM